MSDIVKRLREPPFGTETSERNLMSAAADRIDELVARLNYIESHIERRVKDHLFITKRANRLLCGKKQRVRASEALEILDFIRKEIARG